jgi:DNA-binding NarL/FixJ family response regulator
LPAENSTLDLSIPVTQLVGSPDHPADNSGELGNPEALNFGADFESQAMKFAEPASGALTVGLIDCYRFNRECLVTVLKNLHPNVMVLPFASVRDWTACHRHDIDIAIYCPRSNDNLDAAITRDVGAIRQAAPDLPLVVISDVDDVQQPKAIRSTLSSGAHGFIPMRTTGILMAIAAIRFVKAGGTFAPLNQLLTDRPEHKPSPIEAASPNPLTSRQMAVLSHLRLGKANKMIAHELSMSESTVKVHIRNIMRKMGASNRTQAAYKAHHLWNRIETTTRSDS